MGHREELLRGARQCLYEKGYARTTARDLVAASGTNLASIGYHFGSKEALLNEALIEATAAWGDALDATVSGAGAGLAPGSTERFRATWNAILALFRTHRPLWVAQFEMVAQLGHAPDLLAQIAAVQTTARTGLAELFQGLGDDADPAEVARVGSFHQALLVGVMALWLVDPDTAPSADDLAAALLAVSAGLGG